MAKQHVLDNRQSESGAAGRARATAVDAIEPLGQPRQMFRCDADARVGRREDPGSVPIDAPGNRDSTVRGRITDRVAYQIAECARQLFAASEHACRVADRERNLVLALRQRLRLVRNLQHQRHDREALVGDKVVLAFERGKREQIGDQVLHVVRLLEHQLQKPRALARIELHVLHRLDKAADDGQRRLQLVRDVGDEVAAHARQRLELRHVARHQHLLVERERHELQRQRDPRIAAGGDDDRIAVVAGFQIPQELGLPDEIDDRRAAVVREIEPELRERARIGPFDPVVLVEHESSGLPHRSA